MSSLVSLPGWPVRIGCLIRLQIKESSYSRSPISLSVTENNGSAHLTQVLWRLLKMGYEEPRCFSRKRKIGRSADWKEFARDLRLLMVKPETPMVSVLLSLPDSLKGLSHLVCIHGWKNSSSFIKGLLCARPISTPRSIQHRICCTQHENLTINTQ
jgi:hypothetical protein